METLRRIKDCVDNRDTVLDLSDQGLTSIPDELAELTWLESLNLQGNHLGNLVDFKFSSLRRLKTLILGYGHIRDIPVSICDLVSLENLDLRGNNIRDIMPALFQIKTLKILNLSQNRIEIVPEEIRNLAPREENKETGEEAMEGLSWLDLSQNSIKEMPEGIFALTSLITLDLHDNQIQLIPDEIRNLTELSYFDLTKNYISHISHYITTLKNIDVFRLKSNPITAKIPHELLENDQDKISNGKSLTSYFGKQLHEILEAKVILVGEGAVGKTSIIQRIIYDRFNENSPKTDGIDIHSWKIQVTKKDSSSRTIRLNIWDFGGQEIYHSTHRFFLTQRSLYLLVINSRRDFSNRLDLEYWLTTIKNHVQDPKNAPVIIIANKVDENPQFTINIADLRRYYSNIVDAVKISCPQPELGDGIHFLKELIRREISNLHHVFDEIPLNWLRAKEKLEEIANNQSVLSSEVYEKILRDSKIEEDQFEDLIQLFHDLGVLLNFYDRQTKEPEEGNENEYYEVEYTKILDPNWVTRGVFSIIRRDSDYINNGVLNKKDLKFLLDNRDYPTPVHRTFIFDMMRKYELSFPLSGGNRCLIPDLLPEEEPEIDWDVNLCLRFEYHYPEILPQTIMSKFIVRRHNYIVEQGTPNQLWRTGCILHHDSNKALVRAEKGRKISVFVYGTGNKLSTLQLIRFTFDDIHLELKGLVYIERIPIPNKPDATVEYKALKAAERYGKDEVYVSDLDEYVPVKPLLLGIDEPKSAIELFDILKNKLNDQGLRTLLFLFMKGNYSYENLPSTGFQNKLRDFLEELDRKKDFYNLMEFLRNNPDYRYVLYS